MDQAHRKGDHAVSKLPDSFGKSFATLDAYLKHLEKVAGPVDKPWWRQVEPGVYEEVTSMRPAGKPIRATRAELMKRYGFKH